MSYKITYPDRYYAQFDPNAEQPAPIIGWYDMNSYPSTAGMPALSELFPLSEGFWQTHIANPQTALAIHDGKIVPYVEPPPPLKDRAQDALYIIMSQAPSLTVMGEVFGPQTRSCVQSLRAIISGADTTSTELPAIPKDLTV